MNRRRFTVPLLTLLAVMLLFSSCGALRKTPPSLPTPLSWEGPSGHIGEVVIIVEDDVVVLDLEDLDDIIDEEYLAQAAIH